MSTCVFQFVYVPPICVSFSLEFLYSMYFGVTFVYPFDGGVESVAVIGGYF